MGRFTILIFLSFLFIGGCRYVIVEPSSDIDIIYPSTHNPVYPYSFSYRNSMELVYFPRYKPPKLRHPRIYYSPMLFTVPSIPIFKERPYYNKPIPRRYSSVNGRHDASRSIRVRDRSRNSIDSRQHNISRSIKVRSRKSVEGNKKRRHDPKSNTSSIRNKKRQEDRTQIRSRTRRSKR